jgi:hypothetical protein
LCITWNPPPSLPARFVNTRVKTVVEPWATVKVVGVPVDRVVPFSWMLLGALPFVP